MVLGQVSVDVHPPQSDGQFSAVDFDLESLRRLSRHAAASHHIDRLRAPATILQIHILIPVGIEVHAPLLPQHRLVQLLRVESFTAVIATHVRSPDRSFVSLP